MSQTFALIVLVASVVAFSDWFAQTPVGRRLDPWLHRALTVGSVSWEPSCDVCRGRAEEGGCVRCDDTGVAR